MLSLSTIGFITFSGSDECVRRLFILSILLLSMNSEKFLKFEFEGNSELV